MTVQQYLTQIDRILAFPGTTVTDEFNATRATIEAVNRNLIDREKFVTEQLEDAIRDGNPSRVPELVSQAATATIEVRPIATQAIEGVGLQALQDHYEATATKNYDVLRAEFNKQAAKLTQAAEKVDIDISDARALLPLPKDAQNAWQTAAMVVRTLDELASLLDEAATAAGVNVRAIGTLPTDYSIANTVDPAGVHLRRLWEAWHNDSGHHLGRWGALLAAGVTITARPLTELTPVALPRPLEVRQRRVQNGALVGYEQFTVDPEDDDYTPLDDHGFRGRRFTI